MDLSKSFILGYIFAVKSPYLNPRKKPLFAAKTLFVRGARKQLTWKALFVARWQKCGGRRDGRCSIPGGYDIRLHPVTRRKLQNLLLLLAASPSTSARRERLHGRQKADPAHVFPPRFRFRAEMACANDRPINSMRDYLRPADKPDVRVPTRYIR